MDPNSPVPHCWVTSIRLNLFGELYEEIFTIKEEEHWIFLNNLYFFVNNYMNCVKKIEKIVPKNWVKIYFYEWS